MRTPVALIVFNRPELTSRVAEAVAKARPPRVFVLADGPRPDRPGEAEKCAATRAVIDRIDWPCEVIKKYSDMNLGCGRGPALGITWVFEQAEHAIILEDDCLPHPTFFQYCDDLLEQYRDDERIMQIAGSNFQCGHKRGNASYFFSRFKICWGWATWRRAWRHMDMGMKLWPALRDSSWLMDLVGDARATQHWAAKFEDAYRASGLIDYWDYQWLFATLAHDGLCVMPNVNLVSNIGFGKDATHTTWTGSQWANLPLEEMPFPLQHPSGILRDKQADDFFVQEVVLTDMPKADSTLQRVLGKARKAYTAAIPRHTRLFLRNLRTRP
jgi:hypothetical protein